MPNRLATDSCSGFTNPYQKLRKVMFLQMSVSHTVNREGLGHACAWGRVSRVNSWGCAWQQLDSLCSRRYTLNCNAFLLYNIFLHCQVGLSAKSTMTTCFLRTAKSKPRHSATRSSSSFRQTSWASDSNSRKSHANSQHGPRVTCCTSAGSAAAEQCSVCPKCSSTTT